MEKKETLVIARLRHCQNDNTHTEEGLVLQFRNGLYSTTVPEKKRILRHYNRKLWDIERDDEEPWNVKKKKNTAVTLADVVKPKSQSGITSQDRAEFGEIDIRDHAEDKRLNPEDYAIVDEDPDHVSRDIESEKLRLEALRKQKEAEAKPKEYVEVDRDTTTEPLLSENQKRMIKPRKVLLEKPKTAKYDRLKELAILKGYQIPEGYVPKEAEMLAFLKEHI